MLTGQKTFIVSVIGGGLGLLELFGIDFPFIDDPIVDDTNRHYSDNASHRHQYGCWPMNITAIIAVIKQVSKAISAFLSYVRSQKDIELGEHRQKEKQREANEAVLDAVDDVDVSSVSDDEITR